MLIWSKAWIKVGRLVDGSNPLWASTFSAEQLFAWQWITEYRSMVTLGGTNLLLFCAHKWLKHGLCNQQTNATNKPVPRQAPWQVSNGETIGTTQKKNYDMTERILTSPDVLLPETGLCSLDADKGEQSLQRSACDHNFYVSADHSLDNFFFAEDPRWYRWQYWEDLAKPRSHGPLALTAGRQSDVALRFFLTMWLRLHSSHFYHYSCYAKPQRQ